MVPFCIAAAFLSILLWAAGMANVDGDAIKAEPAFKSAVLSTTASGWASQIGSAQTCMSC
jgi:hypothetical protein